MFAELVAAWEGFVGKGAGSFGRGALKLEVPCWGVGLESVWRGYRREHNECYFWYWWSGAKSKGRGSGTGCIETEEYMYLYFQSRFNDNESCVRRSNGGEQPKCHIDPDPAVEAP